MRGRDRSWVNAGLGIAQRLRLSQFGNSCSASCSQAFQRSMYPSRAERERTVSSQLGSDARPATYHMRNVERPTVVEPDLADAAGAIQRSRSGARTHSTSRAPHLAFRTDRPRGPLNPVSARVKYRRPAAFLLPNSFPQSSPFVRFTSPLAIGC